jgi:hypothetical protein
LLITFGATFISDANEVEGKGKWSSKVSLRYKNNLSNDWEVIEGTRSYSFEETTAVTVETRLATQTNLALSNGYSTLAKAQLCLRRWSGWTWCVKGLSAGVYTFCVSVSSKVEQGFSSARSFTCEVFYG